MALAPGTSETIRSAGVRITDTIQSIEAVRAVSTMPEARELSLAITHLEDGHLRLRRALGLA